MCEKEFFTRAEAADYLGLSAQTLANHRHDGPPSYKMFGAVRYSKAELTNWVRQQRVTRPGHGNVVQLNAPRRLRAA